MRMASPMKTAYIPWQSRRVGDVQSSMTRSNNQPMENSFQPYFHRSIQIQPSNHSQMIKSSVVRSIILALMLIASALVSVTLFVSFLNKTTTTTTVTTTTMTTATTTTSTTFTTSTTSTTSTSPPFIIYSEAFIVSSTPTTQCTQWLSFTALLTNRSYSSLNIKGTFDSVGRTLTDSSTISNIAYALRTSTSYSSALIDGHQWSVGLCGSGYELVISPNTGVCACATSSYSVRPCIGNVNFGGINTATCSAPSQTMTVIFTL